MRVQNYILFNTDASSESIHSRNGKTSIFLALLRLQLVVTFVFVSYTYVITFIKSSQHKCLQGVSVKRRPDGGGWRMADGG